MSRTITDLEEPFQGRVRAFLAELDKQGIKYAVTETRRSYLAQAEAFRQGASKRDGLRAISLHQAGLAIDVVPLGRDGKPTWRYAEFRDEYRRIGAIGKSFGFEWGGDWAPLDPATGLGWDAPHYEYKGA